MSFNHYEQYLLLTYYILQKILNGIKLVCISRVSWEKHTGICINLIEFVDFKKLYMYEIIIVW